MPKKTTSGELVRVERKPYAVDPVESIESGKGKYFMPR